jgi:hypothetical protein
MRYALFVIYSWNYEVLLTALQSYAAAGLRQATIVVDNSADRRIVGDAAVAELVAEVMPTRAKLTFSQTQNFIAGALGVSALPVASLCRQQKCILKSADLAGVFTRCSHTHSGNRMKLICFWLCQGCIKVSDHAVGRVCEVRLEQFFHLQSTW